MNDELLMEEIELDEVEILMEADTPGIGPVGGAVCGAEVCAGAVCGFGCGGAICGI